MSVPQCRDFSGWKATLVAAVLLTGLSRLHAQETTGSPAENSPAAAEPAAAAAQPPAASPVPAATPPAETATPGGAPANAQAEYQQAVLKQQQWARDVAAIRNPLLPAEAEAEFTKLSRNYRTLLTNGPNLSSANDLNTMRKGLEFRILRASDPAVQESPRQMLIVLGDLRRDLKSVGSQITNPQNKERFRRDVMKEAHTLLLKLLDNNLDSRSFAINVLTDLEVVSASFEQKRIMMYEEVDNTLATILTDDRQPDVVRAMAANSIRLLLQKTEAFPVEQMDLARVLNAQLTRTDSEVSYQLLLIDALSQITQPREVQGRAVPSVFEGLISVVGNRQRFLQVRCRAARGLGRAGYDSQINFDPLAWKVAQLSVDAGQYFNQAPGNPAFQQCGVDLYLAFHHANAAEQSDPKNPRGMLNRARSSQVVKDAYREVLKIAGPMIFTNKAIPRTELAAVDAWVSQNVPANLVYDGAGQGTPVSK